MKTYRNLWQELCSYENLQVAFEKASRGKTQKPYVIEFERDIKSNIQKLRIELLFHCYRPQPLVTFILRDPKIRKISKSHFRDRVVHHAICNIIEPFFEREFIYDSYANRIGKGTLKAIQRFDKFKRKVSKNNSHACFILKADIKAYFDNVNNSILTRIIEKKILDQKVMHLIKIILRNHTGDALRKGMPLGNLTSQFFANVYLNELDQYVKQKLKIKYYLRYVDDFIILHNDRKILGETKEAISSYLKNSLGLDLHPAKSKIHLLNRGVAFLGFRIFYWHKLLRKSNRRKYFRKIEEYKTLYDEKFLSYDTMYNSFQGWQGYTRIGNTYKLRDQVRKKIEKEFPHETASVEINKLLKQTNIF
ncbi:hypothetical protein HZA98_02285 [Candidatus Woesearchaeota archaeon]|nr:hypothetical protein [Candidatus Woesearchaeota archaeon]